MPSPELQHPKHMPTHDSYDGSTPFQEPIRKLELSNKTEPFIQLRKVQHTFIDASCLRTYKGLYHLGSPMLYGNNCFAFEIITEDYVVSSNRFPPWCRCATEKWPQEINDGISQVQNTVPEVELKEWVWKDPFLHFLYIIHPRNAALLKRLRFVGTWRAYVSSYEVQTLEMYTPFIDKLCPNLKTLFLNIDPHRGYLNHFSNLTTDRLLERLLTKFLEEHVWNLKSLKTLILPNTDVDTMGMYKPMGFPLAVETMQWFSDREAKRRTCG
ncbi:hypothetical protein DSL72_007180 [Monilinia vaccinii-corymbosi]|uniref:Uncharacterized protein n=1 Tax=Monilinia vaccinii-corymbosi TaxID=61207 RepID=A0A8A3PMI2_9HELO|nr:hypothetical protein DSL72_007180 [Monilinia vaccinii-corymbosi]